MNHAREVGGDFHDEATDAGAPLLELPDRAALFSMGRGALAEVLRTRLAAQGRLFVPAYFCAETLRPIEESGVRLTVYSDHPALPHPDWSTLNPSPGDGVLVVNYFGVRSDEPWRVWRAAQRGVLTIEDHTHDPFSRWARSSEAEFAFASLRKSLPVPDGAILWSPAGLPLPAAPPMRPSAGAAAKAGAMRLKAEYLRNTSPTLKTRFRALQLRGESWLDQSRSWGVSPWSQERIRRGFPAIWRANRGDNVERFLSRTTGTTQFEPLFTRWPEGAVPFNPVLVFPSREARDAARSAMSAARVYCPIHWALEPGSQPAYDLSKRVLTVPLDHRASVQDVDRVAALFMGLSDKPT